MNFFFLSAHYLEINGSPFNSLVGVNGINRDLFAKLQINNAAVGGTNFDWDLLEKSQMDFRKLIVLQPYWSLIFF